MCGCFQAALEDMVRSLRGLLNKSSLNMTDVMCAISTVMHDHPAILSAVHQLLLIFILHAQSGYLVAMDVLAMVTHFSDTMNLAVLPKVEVDFHQYAMANRHKSSGILISFFP